MTNGRKPQWKNANNKDIFNELIVVRSLEMIRLA